MRMGNNPPGENGLPCDTPKTAGTVRRIGKPSETMGRKTRGYRTVTFAKRGPVLRSFGCAVYLFEGKLANHWKQWDAKPEASEHSSTFVRLHGKSRETVRRKIRG